MRTKNRVGDERFGKVGTCRRTVNGRLKLVRGARRLHGGPGCLHFASTSLTFELLEREKQLMSRGGDRGAV